MMGRERPAGRWPFPFVVVGLSVLLVLVMVVAVAVGGVRYPLREVVGILLGAVSDPGRVPVTSAERIILGVRLPRIAVAALAGASLAVAGALLSGALRNPLAEPVTTGTAAGALLGASVVLFAGPAAGAHLVGGPSGLGAMALRMSVAAVFAFLATFVVVRAALHHGGRILGGPLLLAGLAVNAVVGSIAALLLFTGPIGAQTGATLIVSWTFGHLLAAAGSAAFWALLAVLVLAVGGWSLLAHPLDLLLTGEEEAASAGLHVGRVRLGAVALASLLVGAAVGAVGIVAFVGLVAPMVLRRWTGPGHLRLVPAAALFGAALLVAADAMGRTIAGPVEVPAGVITAAIGAPFLLAYLAKTGKGVER